MESCGKVVTGWGACRGGLPIGRGLRYQFTGRFFIFFSPFTALPAYCTLMALQSQRMIMLQANILSFQKGLGGGRTFAS